MQNSVGISYSSAQTVVPSNTLGINCKAIYVGGIGSITLTTTNTSTPVTFTAVGAGTIIPIMIDGGFIQTSSTATLMIALS